MPKNTYPSFVIGSNDGRYVYDYQEGLNDDLSIVTDTTDLDKALTINTRFVADVIAVGVCRISGFENFQVIPVEITVSLRKVEAPK